ncbi:hypothetical protein BH09SUM1_BH09SUM1_01850 [soil metagenome]
MPIRYYVDLNCIPREELGAAYLLELIVTRERADAMRAKFIEKYQLDDESRMRFQEKKQAAQGADESRERSVAELRAETAALDEYAHHCAGCPAALAGSPYSCTQAIGLPISLAAQQWLLARLAPGGTRSLALFLEAANLHGYGKAPALVNWRKAGIMEGEKPPQEERGAVIVTADQILNEILLVGDVMPNHALGVLIHLQALAASDGRRGDDLLKLIEHVDETAVAGDAPSIDFDIAEDQADDESTRDMKLFLYAIFRAFSLQVPVAIRV